MSSYEIIGCGAYASYEVFHRDAIHKCYSEVFSEIGFVRGCTCSQTAPRKATKCDPHLRCHLRCSTWYDGSPSSLVVTPSILPPSYNVPRAGSDNDTAQLATVGRSASTVCPSFESHSYLCFTSAVRKAQVQTQNIFSALCRHFI